MTLQELDDIFQSLVRNDGQLSAIRKKIKDGKATFKDTAAYNERISTLFGETLSRHITDIPEDQRKDVCEKLLRGRYIDMNSKLAQVQTALDEAEGIRIAPQRPAFSTERVRKVAGALEDKTASEEVIRRRANGPVANVSKSFHDDYMKTNATFRSRMGIKCFIDRVAAPGCCEWCTKIAGHYNYGEEPEDVYHRHDNCSCTTTYKNGRERQDVWSKKTWNTPEPSAGAAPPTVLTGKAESSIVNIERLFRRTSNAGPFEHLQEKMSKKHIRSLAQKYRIDISGLTLNIDMNLELLDFPLAGEAVPEHIGTITFFPNAFKNEEELVRTLFHEREHVRQFRAYGPEYVQMNRSIFEKEAEQLEEEFIANAKKEGLL